MRKNILMGFFFLLGTFVNTSMVTASSNNESPQEQEIHNIVKHRLYPGGQDEEPLRVQSELVQPVRKLSIVTEETEEDEPSSDDHD